MCGARRLVWFLFLDLAILFSFVLLRFTLLFFDFTACPLCLIALERIDSKLSGYVQLYAQKSITFTITTPSKISGSSEQMIDCYFNTVSVQKTGEWLAVGAVWWVCMCVEGDYT